MEMESAIENEPPLNETELKICSVQSEWRKVSRKKMRDFPEKYTINRDKFVFFWYDMIDFKPRREISLIGKRYNKQTNDFESCCVTISNVPKTFYLLPRNFADGDLSKTVKLRDIYEEFRERQAKELGVKSFKSKVVVKRSLDKNVPFLGKYLEVTCKVGDGGLEIEEGATFSKVLGGRLGFVETFFLQRKIKGPCWLQVENVCKKNFLLTKCLTEVSCTSIDDITNVNDVLSVPPSRILIFNIKTVCNKVKNINEICLISWIFCDKFNINTQQFNIKEHCCGLHPVFGLPHNFKEHIKTFSDTKVIITYTEKDLLNLFLDCFEHYEIDMVLSYDLTGKDLEILFEKIVLYELKCSSLSCRRFKNQLNKEHKTDLFCGKLLFNLKSLSEGFVKSTSYSLQELITDILKVPYIKLNEDFIRKSFDESTTLRHLITLTMWETYCVFDLAIKLKIFPFTFELTRICGNTWNNTLNGTVSDLCESLLLHSFHEENYIISDRSQRGDNDKDGSFRGGLVLEPKIGLYNDYIVAMDFFALYPSIIREFNLCPSTYYKDDEGKYISSEDRGTGVLQKVIERLLNIRKLKKSNQTDTDIQQEVIKKITNSLYGYLAYENSMFYSKGVAEFIAAAGRKILTKAVDVIAGEFGFEVVYGDTDSIIFKPNCDTLEAALQAAKVVKNPINSKYKHIKLEISSVYKPLIIFNKKRYAGVECYRENQTVSPRYVYKGLEMVRRDFPGIVGKLQENLLNDILKGSICTDKSGTHSILREFERNIHDKKFDVEEFGITKKLNEKPEEYKDFNQPHVQVALSNFGKSRNLRKNDYITYVYCSIKNETKPYHIDEFKHNDRLDLDIRYYMELLVVPVALRMLDNFGITENEIRDCLNLRRKTVWNIKESESDCYEIICVFCSSSYDSELTGLDFLKGCKNCKFKIMKNVSNYLTLFIRFLLIKYLNHNKEKFCQTCNNVTKISTDLNKNKNCLLCGDNAFTMVNEILEKILKTLQENNLDDLTRIVKNRLDTFQFELKVDDISNPNTKKFSKEWYIIYCVFCDKPYTFRYDTLDFLKPCLNCKYKWYKNRENYFKILLRKLMAKFYDFQQGCDNHSCKSTCNYLTLKRKKSNYCQVCNLGYLEVKIDKKELYETLKCMHFALKRNNYRNMAKMVREVFECSEYYDVDFVIS